MNLKKWLDIPVCSQLGKTQNIETYITIHFVIRVCFSKILYEETFCCIAFYIYSQVKIHIRLYFSNVYSNDFTYVSLDIIFGRI